MANKPLSLSIVIPVYNEQRNFDDCLRSIARQSVKPDEVIVVDNNSTDDSVKIAQKYPFVKILHEKHQGVVYARNCGFNSVKSDIIGRIDGDVILPVDWVNKIKLFYADPANQMTALSGSGYFRNVRCPNFNGWVLDQIAFRTNRWLLGHYVTWGSNCAIPRDLWVKIRQSMCLRSDIHEDLDLAIHLHRNGAKIIFNKNLRVSAVMKRVRSGRTKLLGNMLLWPQTLKVHGLKTWGFGWVGAVFLWSFWWVIVLAEKLAVIAGRPPLRE